jgi:hypothetical protein
LPGRIQAPNSKPRSIALVGLGEGGAVIARNLSRDIHPSLEVHVLAKSASGAMRWRRSRRAAETCTAT